MAGILDTKKRIMDTIVTQEGRRQLSSGNFKIKYASFTDGNVFYEEDLVEGTTDATLRIPFEVVNKFQDNIIFETDDSGNLLHFSGKGIELNIDGSIAIEDSDLDDPSSIRRIVSSSAAFSSAAEGLTTASFDSFEDQNFITTNSDKDRIPFSANGTSDSFNYTINSSLDNSLMEEKSLNSLPSFIQDKHFSNILNFKFLPPINANDKTDNGTYKNFKKTNEYNKLAVLLDYRYKYKPGISYKPRQSIIRKLTGNNTEKILLQIFETNTDTKKIIKLDMIDHGRIDANGIVRRIIFVGKVMIDSFDQPTFVKMFTIEATK
jgi:hypothetical protein